MRLLFLLPEPPRPPLNRWVTSLVIHTGAIGFLLIIPFAFHEAVTTRPPVRNVALVQPPPPYVAPIRIPKTRVVASPVVRVKPLTLPPPVAVAMRTPEIPKPIPEAPKVEVAKLVQPKLELAPELPPAPPAPKPQHEVKVGGFGDPNGVHASVSSNAPSQLAKVGAFDLPQGAGSGGGSGRPAVVASSGFGDATGSAASGSGHGSVQSSGFGDLRSRQTPAAPPRTVAAETPVLPQTPVEIISKPRPVYTAEARAQHIEGEVQLEVVFCSNGAIRVNKIVRGLGMGLDESARQAAVQIKFRPGTRGGVPIDMTGIVHIVFELS